ncbi:class I SAM-dependent methyltransferase [Chloroflexota bacterium]
MGTLNLIEADVEKAKWFIFKEKTIRPISNRAIMKIKCPCCQSEIIKEVVYSKKNCPVLNNVVYGTEKEARNCTVGNVELVLCPVCGFVFNCDFKEKLISYNEDYDGVRTYSKTYQSFLGELVGIFSTQVSQKTRILEIGCGKGEFLTRLCLISGAMGFGYDITYQGEANYLENLSFFKKNFDPSESKEKYDIVILRHVLEHITNPNDFLKRIYSGKILSPGAKLWIEVPDFKWTMKNGVFYDITYEHCNYFTEQSLLYLLSTIGYKVKTLKNVFGGQYILAKAIFTQDKPAGEKQINSPSSILGLMKGLMEKRETYNNLINKAKEICIWGASGKGVIFLSELTDEILDHIKFVIDVNPRKQGKFLPGSGKRVEPPEALKRVTGPVDILIMNEIYEKEIKNQLIEMGVNAQTHVF